MRLMAESQRKRETKRERERERERERVNTRRKSVRGEYDIYILMIAPEVAKTL